MYNLIGLAGVSSNRQFLKTDEKNGDDKVPTTAVSRGHFKPLLEPSEFRRFVGVFP